MVRWPLSDQHPGETDRVALTLPLRYGTTVSGVLVLTDADGRADCGQDDLILGQGLADQAAVAIANAELLARATAMLEERTRLARDIHDTLAQGLTGIVVQLGAAQRRWRRARRIARAPGVGAAHGPRVVGRGAGGRCGIYGRRRLIAATSRTPCGRWRSALWEAMWP